ncbi:unnamed protein product [Arabis nemorensis]|uniref:RRM domain-containing protein n=1 Tax=Arabis nemorensis TaxID=586526 RepID=A0A565BGM8_9BRAS|nr:unnamed protein product [Arabis nemorensis]
MNQSHQVIGFLFLLEQNHYARNLISSLVSLPDAFINAVANEIVVCLSFLYNNDYFSSMFFGANNNNYNFDQSVIPLIIRITGGRLSLSVLNQNRERLLLGLRNILTNVCHRAFEDLCARAERYNKEKILALEREKTIENLKKIRLSAPQGTSSRLSVQKETTHKPSVQQVWVPTRYPISEEEIRVYFTKKFGEVIEETVMQEVEENEQPLYARMVLKMRYVSKMEEIVCGRNRNKYTINGKHVWARKYVRKNLTSSASPSSSQI